MNIEAAESALVDAIEEWMQVPIHGAIYAHGNAQGIARALATLRSTTFSAEWEAGLDRYQNRVVTGSDKPRGSAMSIVYTLFIAVFIVTMVKVFAQFFDGQPLQPSARETLIKRCEEQHAALMRGDEHTGFHGKFPPAKLD